MIFQEENTLPFSIDLSKLSVIYDDLLKEEEEVQNQYEFYHMIVGNDIPSKKARNEAYEKYINKKQRLESAYKKIQYQFTFLKKYLLGKEKVSAALSKELETWVKGCVSTYKEKKEIRGLSEVIGAYVQNQMQKEESLQNLSEIKDLSSSLLESYFLKLKGVVVGNNTEGKIQIMDILYAFDQYREMARAAGNNTSTIDHFFTNEKMRESLFQAIRYGLESYIFSTSETKLFHLYKKIFPEKREIGEDLMLKYGIEYLKNS